MGLTNTNSCAVPVGVTRIRAETERECAHGYVCAVGQGEQRGSTPRVYAFAFVQTSAAWPRGRHKTDGVCAARTQRQELNEQI
jgi:hypothetical protein